MARIYYDSDAHPLIHDYLEDECLIWPDWERIMPVLMNLEWAGRQLRRRDRALWRISRRGVGQVRRLPSQLRGRGRSG